MRPNPGDERAVILEGGFYAGLWLGDVETARDFTCPVCGSVVCWWPSEEPFGPDDDVTKVRHTGEEVCFDCADFLEEELNKLAEVVQQRIMWNLRLSGVIR